MKMNRWVRLVASVIAMCMIANLQYSWALFVKPIMGATHWKLSDVQLGFTLFIFFETWMMPLAGWFMGRVGPGAHSDGTLSSILACRVRRRAHLLRLHGCGTQMVSGQAGPLFGTHRGWFRFWRCAVRSFDRLHHPRGGLSNRFPLYRNRSSHYHALRSA